MSFILREVGNGWVLEVSGPEGCIEYIYSRPNQAIGMIRKVLNGDINPFEEGEE